MRPIAGGRIVSRLSSYGCHDADDVMGHLHNVAFFDEMQEDAFERRLADVLADFRGGSLSDDLSFAEDDEVGADFFDDFENVRAIEDCFAARAESLDEVFDDEDGGDVETGERLVEDENVGIVHESGDKQDALAHPLGIGTHGDVAVRPEGKEVKERTDGFGFVRLGHGAQGSDHVEIFLARQVGIQIGFLGHIAEAFAIRDEIFADVLAVVDDLAVGGLEEAREHFDRGAFAGAVGAEVAQHLSGFERKGDVPNGQDGAVEFGESSGLEHRPSLRSWHPTRGAGYRFDTAEARKFQETKVLGLNRP